MTDIADRLRAASCCNGNCQVPERQDELCVNSRLRGEAAAELDRLRAEFKRFLDVCGEGSARGRAIDLIDRKDFERARRALEGKP